MTLKEMNLNKKIWDFCKEHEGDLPNMHIINVTNDINPMELSYRIYHSKRYCIEVTYEGITEGEPCNHIDGVYYGFSSDTWEGYEDISVEDTVKLLGL